MNAKEILDTIKNDINSTHGKGQENISSSALINYLNDLEKDISYDAEAFARDHATKLAIFKADNDRNIAITSYKYINSVEMFKSIIATGQSALKSSMLINGGAATALLAFVAKIWSTSISPIVANGLTSAILFFCIGVLCAAIATGVTYLVQQLYSIEWIKSGHVVTLLIILLVLASYFLFLRGAYLSITAMTHHFV